MKNLCGHLPLFLGRTAHDYVSDVSIPNAFRGWDTAYAISNLMA